MNTVLTQEDIDIFGSDPETIKEKPGTTDYANGVEVQYTAPAKWWNWLWNALTSFLTHHKSDNQSMLTEEVNLLSSAGFTPSSSDGHQITKSFRKLAEDYAEEYDEETIEVDGVERPVNKPYVTGGTIVLPATELL